MHRIMFAIAAAATIAIAAIPATTHAAERRFTVTGFDRIEVEGPFQVNLSTGRPSSAIARGSNEAIDRLSVSVQGRVLKLRPNLSGWGSRGGDSVGPLEIELSTHELRSATLVGSAFVNIDRVRAMRFDASISGSGRLSIGEIDADRLNLSLLGSGAIAVAGNAKSMRIAAEGTGDVDASGLAAEDAEITSGSAGKVLAKVRRSAKILSTGSGEIRVSGNPSCTVKSTGFGQISCGETD